MGLEKWRLALHQIRDVDSLSGDEKAFKASEGSPAEQWVNEIEANLRAQLAPGESFTVVSRYMEVCGSAVGQARQTHLRKAWRPVVRRRHDAH